MRFEDWMRVHVTPERLQEVERLIEEQGLLPPSGLFEFTNGALTEIVYRIHHESVKAISHSESLATMSLGQLLFLFFGQTGEATSLRVMFLKHLRSRRSDLYNYFIVIEKATKRLEERKGEHFNVKKDSLKVLGAALFWYVTLLACIEVTKKVLADDKWERGTPLTWDEATAEYVAYWFSTRDELDTNLWWPPSKFATMQSGSATERENCDKK
jgi:hypothetical protein